MHTDQARVLLASAGFACFLALNSFSLWGFTLLPETALGVGAPSLWSVPLSIGNALSFVACVVCSYRFPDLVRGDFLVPAVLLTALALILMSGSLVMELPLMLVVAGVCMGIGTTCSFFCWGRRFFCEGVEHAKMGIVIGSMLSAVPFLAFLTLDPSAIIFTLGLLALLNLAVLFVLGRLLMQDGTYEVPIRRESFSTLIRSTWKALLCVLMVGFMAPVVAALSHAPVVSMTFTEQTFMVHSENAIAAILLGIVWFGFKKHAGIIETFTILFPVLVTSLLLFPFIGDRGHIFVPYVSGITFVVFSIVVLMESISVSQRDNISLVTIYGLFAGVLYCANLVGSLLLGGIDDDFFFQETSIMVVILVLLYGCSIVMFFILRKPRRLDGNARDEGISVESAGTVDTVDAQCDTMAFEQGFSKRQLEVLKLIARGFDIPTIAKKLYVSENTVRTHAKKIYAALDVHSKQEIIERVNANKSPSDDGEGTS